MKKVETGLGAQIDEALGELYTLYDDRLLSWFAGLWDNQGGGFYYSNSARDYEGFLPDVESTCQALGCLEAVSDVSPFGGMPGLLSEKTKKLMADFVCSLEDEDGYFYHPQWGKEIGTARRGRDVNWAISHAKHYGYTFPYPTAYDRFRSGDVAGLPAHLTSKEAFIEYLDRLDIESHSHNKGHMLNSQHGQIVAAGLAPTLFDYCDALQERVQQKRAEKGLAPNGLFQESIDYVAISGLFKLGAIYNGERRPFKYAEHMIDSGIEAILSDVVPEVVIYVFNPWSGLTAAVQNMEQVNKDAPGTYDMEAVYEKIRRNAPEMIRKTAKKLEAFKRPDGAFSYCVGHAASYTQAVHVSLGIDEGEVNGTVLSVNGVTRSIFACLGVKRPPLFSSEQIKRFADAMEKNPIPEKRPVPEQYKDDPPVKK